MKEFTELIKNLNDNNVISIGALIISLIGLIISWLGYKFSVDQTKSKVGLNVNFEMDIYPKRDDRTYTMFIVSNFGIRDVYFNWPCIGISYLTNNVGYFFMKSYVEKYTSFVLKGGESKSFVLTNTCLKEEIRNIDYVFIWDALHNMYKFQVAKWYESIPWRLYKFMKYKVLRLK